MAKLLPDLVLDDNAKRVAPVSLRSNWVTLETDLFTSDVVESVLDAAGVDRSGGRALIVGGLATSVALRMKYPAAATLDTAPQIALFAFDDHGEAHLLTDADGAYTWTLTPAETDCRNGAWYSTPAIKVDGMGLKEIVPVVVTPLDGDDFDGTVLQALAY